MSAHAIAAEMRAKIRAERRRRRCGDQAAELEARDTFCAQLEHGLNDLVRAIGTSEGLSLRVGERVFGRVGGHPRAGASAPGRTGLKTRAEKPRKRILKIMR